VLRYAFENAEQMRRHLHVVDGQTLLFFPDDGVKLLGGDRTLVEIAIPQRSIATALRGILHSRAEAPYSGVWLQFPEARLAQLLERGDTFPDRKHQRVPVDWLAELRPLSGAQGLVGRMLDLAAGGARLSGCEGLRAGVDVRVRVLGAVREALEIGTARVLRNTSGEAALRFARSDAAARGAITRLFDVARAGWEKARQVRHPPNCCRPHVFEPALPRLRAREEPI
jgi:hypothetical protein